MRRFALVTLIAGMALLASNTSIAADQYTYRAGQAYAKSAASSHMQCETQCRGDAACRGWNFIRPNPRSQTGICEFNARKAVPISSPISISGEINTGVDALMSHAVPLAGMGGNTVRVGTPIVPKRETSKRRVAAPKMAAAPRPSQSQEQRIVRRLPVPLVGQTPTTASFKRSLPTAQNVRTPRIYGGETPKVQTQPQPQFQPQFQQRPMQRRQMTREQIYREQLQAAQKRIALQNPQQTQLPLQRAPQNFVPQPNQQMPVISQQMPAQQRAPQAPRPAPPQAQMPPQQASLYGSLHDDLTQNMTPVPRPPTAPDQVNNPDAPLSTSRAVPTKPVQAEPIGYPAIPGLAGG